MTKLEVECHIKYLTFLAAWGTWNIPGEFIKNDVSSRPFKVDHPVAFFNRCNPYCGTCDSADRIDMKDRIILGPVGSLSDIESCHRYSFLGLKP